MAHLIDKDALVAKIEKLQSEIAEEKKHKDIPMWYNGINHGFNLTKDILNTLEAKEVDLESEMDTYFETMEVLEHEYIFEDTFQRIAKHFFELGLKARQG